MSRRIPDINITPLLFRDVEDLARFSQEYKGKNGEGVFARVTAIVAVMALEHFADLYIDLVRDQKQKADMLERIKIWKERGKNRTMVEAKWYAMSDHWVLGFQLDVPPFSQLGDLVKLRNRLIHPSQKKLRSRIRGGTPQLISGIDSERAAWACKVMKDMVSGFYTLAGRKPPDWLDR